MVKFITFWMTAVLPLSLEKRMWFFVLFLQENCNKEYLLKGKLQLRRWTESSFSPPCFVLNCCLPRFFSFFPSGEGGCAWGSYSGHIWLVPGWRHRSLFLPLLGFTFSSPTVATVMPSAQPFRHLQVPGGRAKQMHSIPRSSHVFITIPWYLQKHVVGLASIFWCLWANVQNGFSSVALYVVLLSHVTSCDSFWFSGTF